MRFTMISVSLAFGLALSIAASSSVLAQEPKAPESTYFTAARMVDVLGGRVVERPLIVIQRNRIVSITSFTATSLPQGAKLIDLGNRTLLPGLIDMHVHIDSGPQYGGYSGLQFTDSFWSALSVKNARDMLDAGFTTIRNVGSSNYNDIGLREAIDEGHAIGPRIIGAGYAIGATGGHCDETFFPPSFNRKSPAVGDGPQALRNQVRLQRKYGAEVIKICATGGVFSRNTEPGQQQLTEDEMRAIVEEASLWGLRVAAHAHGAEGIKAAIRAGIDTIEHASLVDDEGIKLAATRAKPVWFSMDIFNTDYTQTEGKKNGVLEDNLRKDREIAQIQRDNFRRALQAGVKMVFGSDAGVMPHASAGGQFRYMVEYGMTPMQAMQAATTNAAQALGRELNVGAIAVGRFADMIAVDGDPLKDVRVLERVAVVIKGGVVVKSGS